MSYRSSDGKSDPPVVSAGPRFVDDDERRFWEAMACALESCPSIAPPEGLVRDYAHRCDEWLALRRERLATTERP